MEPKKQQTINGKKNKKQKSDMLRRDGERPGIHKTSPVTVKGFW